MRARSHRALLAGLVAVLAVGAWMGTSHAAAPRLVMITGALLDEPVIIDIWDENLALMAGDELGLSSDDLDGRLYLDLALFWGPIWAEYVESGGSLDDLTPDQANQHGRFYPATDTNSAIIRIGIKEYQPAPEALAILERHGIPVHIDTSGSWSLPIRATITGGAMLLVAVFGALAYARVRALRRGPSPID